MYETNNIGPMLDLYIWAYQRSCNQYDTIKKSIGEIDAYRIQYRHERKEVMRQIIQKNIHGNAVEKFIEQCCKDKDVKKNDRFIAMTLTDLDAVHSGTIVGLGISEKQFEKWVNVKTRIKKL